MMSERDDSRQHPDPLRSHEEALASLPGYAAAIALGQAPELRYADLASHLEWCAACRAELDALLELVVPAYRGQAGAAESYPEFELSFLRPPAAQSALSRPSWYFDGLRRLVVEFSEALIRSLQPPSFAQAVRGPAIYHYTPEPAPSNLGLTIDVFADEQAADQGNIQVLLDVPSRDPFDQSGLHVHLSVGERSWEGTTSTTGSVTFGSVPLKDIARMRIEIALPDDS